MLMQVCPDLHDRHIYMCGPAGFMDAFREICGGLQFDLARLHSESFGGLRTSPKTKLAPVGSGAVEADVVSAEGFAVEFTRAGITACSDGEATLLELAEENDVDLAYGCRAGSCGDCKVRLLSGDVEQLEADGLTAGEKAQGYVLACVARAQGACAIEL